MPTDPLVDSVVVWQLTLAGFNSPACTSRNSRFYAGFTGLLRSSNAHPSSDGSPGRAPAAGRRSPLLSARWLAEFGAALLVQCVHQRRLEPSCTIAYKKVRTGKNGLGYRRSG